MLVSSKGVPTLLLFFIYASAPAFFIIFFENLLVHVQKYHLFCLKNLHMSKKSSNFAAQIW